MKKRFFLAAAAGLILVQHPSTGSEVGQKIDRALERARARHDATVAQPAVPADRSSLAVTPGSAVAADDPVAIY